MSTDNCRWVVGNALTGEVLRALPVISGTSAEVSTSGDDTLSCALLLGDEENREIDWKTLLLGGDRFIAALASDNHVIAAGMLTSDFDYDPTSTRLGLSAVSLESWLEDRMVLGVGVDPITTPDATVAIVGKSWRGVAAFVVSQAIQRAPGASPAVIIPAEYLSEGGSSEEYFIASEMRQVSSVINDVRDRGYEIRFVPSMTGTNELIWTMHIGAPLLTNSLELSAPLAALPGTNVRVKTSLKDTITTVWGVRNHVDFDTPFVTKQESIPGGRLLREMVVTADKDESDGAAQAARVANAFNAHRLPESTYTISVWDEEGTILREGLGATCVLQVSNDPWLGTQNIETRVIGMRAEGGSYVVSLTLDASGTTYANRASSASPTRRFVAMQKAASTDISVVKRRI